MINSRAQHGFWANLPRPFFMLAPMDDVCDAAFRRIVATCGKPDVLMTEFVSVAGLCSPGRDHLLRSLWFDEIERPIVAQFFGDQPEKYYQCGRLAKELGFDGVDINMGCPVKKVVKTGCGAALIKNPKLAQEIVAAARQGAEPLPVSVKTRIGYDRIELDQWLPALLETRPAAIILHLRTAREMSAVEAHWETAAMAVQLASGHDTLIVGNGDITGLEHGDKIIEETGMDGVMLGRAIFGHPWLFDRSVRREDISVEEKLSIMQRHASLYEEIFEKRKNFASMRKHLLAYANGFRGARELRTALQDVNNADEVRDLLGRFRQASPLVNTD